MRRRSVSVVWVGVCLMLAGCEGAPEKPTASVASTVQPGSGCDGPGQPECQRLAHVSDWMPVTNEEYGIRAIFPVGSRVCEGLSGAHPHGFFTRVGDDRMECQPSRDLPNLSTLSVWADYNAAFYRTPEEARGDNCRITGVGDDLISPQGRPWAFRGLASQTCEAVEGGGRIRIDVLAYAGTQSVGMGEPDAPRYLYSASLSTTRKTLAADKVVFQRFLDGLVLTPPKPSE